MHAEPAVHTEPALMRAVSALLHGVLALRPVPCPQPLLLPSTHPVHGCLHTSRDASLIPLGL